MSEAEPGLVASILRYRWRILAVTVLLAGAAYFLSASQPPVYTATSQVLLTDPRDPGPLGSSTATRFLDPEAYVPQQAAMMNGPVVLDRAVELLDASVTREQLARAVDTSVEVDLLQVAVRATTSSPDVAAAMANAVARAYEEVAGEQAQQEAELAVAAIESQLASLREQAEEAEASAAADPENEVVASRARILTERIIAIESNASTIAAQAAVAGSGVEAIREAEVPENPAAPDPVRDAAIIGVLVFALAAAAAYWAAGRDDRVKSAGDAAGILGVPLLGEVPMFRATAGNARNGRFTVPPAAAEAFQFLLSSIDFALADVGGRTVMVTSAASGDGKTTAALQLSLAARRDGRDVTLVDGDIRAQGLTTMLAATNHPGLTELMAGSLTVDQAVRRYRIDDDLLLRVLTTGQRPADGAAMARSAGFRHALAEVRATSPLVFMDTSPLLAVVDATVAATQVDAVVLVVSSSTSLAQLRKLKERMAFVATPVLGYIYNRSTSDLAPYDYGYGRQDRGGHWWSRRKRQSPTLSSSRTPVPAAREEEPRRLGAGRPS